MNKKLAESVVQFEAEGNRICNIRIRRKFKSIPLISFYAPTEKAEDEEKDLFCKLLGEEVKR